MIPYMNGPPLTKKLRNVTNENGSEKIFEIQRQTSEIQSQIDLQHL